MDSSNATTSVTIQSTNRPRGSERAPDHSAIQVKRILIPVDFSPNSDKTLDYGFRLARLTHSDVLLLHVFEYHEFPGLLPEPSSWQINYEETKRAFDEAIKSAKERLAGVAHSARHDGVHVRVRICQGTPYEEIVKVAKAEEVELIVIATHGYTGLQHFLLGSTAERVVRTAPCPVLVVRDKEREFAL